MQDDILNGVENETNVVCVCGAGDVWVHLLLVWGLVEVHKATLDKLCSLIVVESTIKLREANVQIDLFDLVSEEVALVQEENERNRREPSGIANLVKELERFMHSINGLVLVKLEIVLAHGYAKDHGGNVLEAVNPLLSLRPLATNIHHPELCVLDFEIDFRDSRRLSSSPQNVLLIGNETRIGDAINALKPAKPRGRPHTSDPRRRTQKNMTKA